VGPGPRTLRPHQRRGPLSAQLLADVGIEADDVGDPVLVSGIPPGDVRIGSGVDRELVGLHAGFGIDLW